MIKAEWKGLDTLRANLRRLADRAKALDGTHNVPVADLLTPSFIQRHTRGCSNVEQWFQKSGFKIESSDDFKAIPDDDWDRYVRSSTSFSNWQAMLTAASTEFVKKKVLG
jgi:hypothetical protein